MDETIIDGGVVIENGINPSTANAHAVEAELKWLRGVIETRVQTLTHTGSVEDLPEAPPLIHFSLYANLIRHYEMGREERLVTILALAPHVRPEILDSLFQVNERLGRGYTQCGGVQGKMHGGFLPTAETALFLLAGSDLSRRFEYQRLFDRDHFFARHQMLRIDPPPAGEPVLCGPLVLADEIVDFLTRGELRKPDFSYEFPAKLITTEMDWEDVVLSPGTREQIRELESWIRFEAILMEDWDLRRRLRPGYRCLFHGPPGTGKTLTATVLGKRMARDVYRIALSGVVSKYVGETEKNLERIFARAENMNCILFFDEADALFGKRTNVSDAHDRYANQEVSYLLQRIEDYSGVVVLASNFIGNMDESFMRRFQAIVHFPMPNEAERLRLWTDSFSKQSTLEPGFRLKDLAARYELSGGAIMNVVRYASLMALEAGSNVISERDVLNGIRREMQKEGKSL